MPRVGLGLDLQNGLNLHQVYVTTRKNKGIKWCGLCRFKIIAQFNWGAVCLFDV